MLVRAIECEAIYSSVLLDDNLTDCILDEVEWRRLNTLKELLGRFNTLTTKVCASKTYATITMTIVVYNNLMEVIENFIKDNKDRLPEICRGAKAAYDNLGYYYAATDNSPIYSVATAIHPAMRFQYWTDQRWGSKYEKSAKKAVRDAWRDQYAASTNKDLTQPSLDASNDDIELALLGMIKKPKEDELEEFVSSPKVMETPLVFWRKNCGSYPGHIR